MNWCAIKSMTKQFFKNDIVISIIAMVILMAIMINFPKVATFLNIWGPRLFIGLMCILIPFIVYVGFLEIRDKYREECERCEKRPKPKFELNELVNTKPRFYHKDNEETPIRTVTKRWLVNDREWFYELDKQKTGIPYNNPGVYYPYHEEELIKLPVDNSDKPVV